MDEELVLDGYRPGALARVIALHMDYYAPAWGFGLAFETKLAREMGAFLARLDPERDLFLAAHRADGTLIGSITIDGIAGGEGGAHLRWFIVAERGRGTGRRLLARACAFVDARGYPLTYLTTFAGLDAARRLYEQAGFRLTAERADDAWSGSVGEQRFERRR